MTRIKTKYDVKLYIPDTKEFVGRIIADNFRVLVRKVRWHNEVYDIKAPVLIGKCMNTKKTYKFSPNRGLTLMKK